MQYITARFPALALAGLIAAGLSACNTNGGMVPGPSPSPPPTHSPVGVSLANPQTPVVAPARTIMRRVPPPRSFKVLYRFPGGRNGALPVASLIDVNGTLYGTTSFGGRLDCPDSCGTVYSMSKTGVEKVLYRFAGGLDGATPESNLVDVNGTLYGTTAFGGGAPCPTGGCGTVYSISTSGNEKVLHSFGEGSDGSVPGGLIDVGDTLYGTTAFGGGSGCSTGCGTVYCISTTGVEKVLYRFAGGSDGDTPNDLVNVKGTLYGTTYYGGGSECSGYGCGTVYSISTTGAEKVLYRFAGGSDGAAPSSSLVNVTGTLYGTTTAGGGSGCSGYGCGTVYSISTSGVEKVLYRFAGGSSGANPEAGLIKIERTLYGTTEGAGISRCRHDCGTVYSISTTGNEKVLHSFREGADGSEPVASVIEVNGALYGTTSGGGLHCYFPGGCGTVFALSL